MKGNPAIVDRLNELLTFELTAINQYWLHARLCEHWGYERFWKKLREESIGEMKHADKLVERVLFLDGLPNLQRLAKLTVGENVVEILKNDLEVEKRGQGMLNEGIEACRAAGDNGSRELLEEILRDTEEHLDWLESQLSLVEQVGEQNFLAQQIRE